MRNDNFCEKCKHSFDVEYCPKCERKFFDQFIIYDKNIQRELTTIFRLKVKLEDLKQKEDLIKATIDHHKKNLLFKYDVDFENLRKK